MNQSAFKVCATIDLSICTQHIQYILNEIKYSTVHIVILLKIQFLLLVVAKEMLGHNETLTQILVCLFIQR